MSDEVHIYMGIVSITVIFVMGYILVIIVPWASRSSSTPPLVEKLYWLPIELCINFKILCITYKALHGLAPNYIMRLLKRYTPSRALHLIEQHLLCIPKVSFKKSGERSFSFSAASLYNSIP